MIAGFGLGMSESIRIYPLNLIILMRVSSMVGAVAGIQSSNESSGPSPYLERRSHWLVGSSRIAVTGVEGHLGNRCYSLR